MAVSVNKRAINQAHVEQLRRRHKELSDEIKIEENRPSGSDEYIRTLKLKKLKVKDAIEWNSKAVA